MAAQLQTPDDIKQLGTILSFWAHPDDETFACAGIMATAIRNGQRVICVTATRGEKGIQSENRWPAEQLAEIRSRELKSALNILGVMNHFFLDYQDGMCEQVALSEGTDQVLKFIREYQPNTILTFGPDGWTGHPDHRAISHWVSGATLQRHQPPQVYHWVELRDHYERFMKDADKRFDIYFNISQPPLRDESECDLCFMCSPLLCEKKCQALAAMPSQMERILKSYDETTLRNMFRPEVFVRAK